MEILSPNDRQTIASQGAFLAFSVKRGWLATYAFIPFVGGDYGVLSALFCITVISIGGKAGTANFAVSGTLLMERQLIHRTDIIAFCFTVEAHFV